MKKLLAFFLSLIILVFSFSGCNNKTAKQENGEPTKVRPEPIAQIAPDEIDPGRQKNASQTSDLWYPDKKDGSYFYLEKTDGLSITFVNDEEKETYTCSITDENHLVAEEKGVCDIVFYDAFNCYDFVQKEWYTRGNVEKIKSSFSGKTLVNVSDSDNIYVFGSEGTITEKYKNTEYTGTWTLIAETVMILQFGNDDYYYTYDIEMDTDGNVIALSQRGGRTFKFEN